VESDENVEHYSVAAIGSFIAANYAIGSFIAANYAIGSFIAANYAYISSLRACNARVQTVPFAAPLGCPVFHTIRTSRTCVLLVLLKTRFFSTRGDANLDARYLGGWMICRDDVATFE
jgi:hypothetical protein